MSEPRFDGGNQAIVRWLAYLFERDPIGHAPAMFDYAHHQQHEGNYYTFGTRLPALDGSVSYLFYNLGPNGSSKRAHWTSFVNITGAGRAFLYESPTVVAPGTLIGDPPIYNHKQGSGTPTCLEIYMLPNISSPGTLRKSLEVGAGVGPKAITGSGVTRDEIIFGLDKYWLVVIDTDAALVVNYESSWYEKEG